MTLCVAVTTANGLIMGADSMTALRVVETDLSKSYAHAEKVFDLPNLPIAAMTYGLGAIGRKSIGILIDEWSEKRPAFEKRLFTVREVAESLGTFIFSQHRIFREQIEQNVRRQQDEALSNPTAGREKGPIEFVPTEWTTGLVIGGYQPDSYFPWLYAWEEPERPGVATGLTCVREHEGSEGEDGPEPGLDYWGDTAPLERLYRGLDPLLLAHLLEHIRPGSIEAVSEAFEKHRWPIIFDGMPLKDAVDLAKFMLEVGCNFGRFGEGLANVGGETDVVVVTRQKVFWPHRKALGAALAIAESRALALPPEANEKGQ